jgi:hypothetical protein
MAGEVIKQIRDMENEASQLISGAHADAKKLLDQTREAKTEFLMAKDKILEKDEAVIREKYADETARVVAEIDEEGKNSVERITAACEQNLDRVVDYIITEIVKE